jgi:hypothetical protein
VNDNFADCNDFSDEPGTGIIANSTFYCQNEFYSPKSIRGWSVGDGICDCCDGSDEIYNQHSNCPNTCGSGNGTQIELIQQLTALNKKFAGFDEIERKKVAKLKAISISGLERVLKKLLHKKERIIRNHAFDVVIPREYLSWGWFSDIIIGLWELFFAAPRVASNLPITRKDVKLGEIETVIERVAKKVKQVKDLERWNDSVDLAFFPLFQKVYTFRGYSLAFMSEVRDGRGVLASFDRAEGDRHFYKGNIRLVDVEMRLICGSSDRWLNFSIGKTYKDYESLFATPVICSHDKIAELTKMTRNELNILKLGL